ncbi:HpcH/HpaI aldolase/citrate lyase family protein [Sphingobium sp. H39-3-25]|uniref:HpcH/HpaI aldolase family protein n=1 Tax=Sphingobium arseniciresistens TaxID=3030834 RepID=UPI0023B9526A|nr:HpcH/HpaI aldolase/citrate lyase family protein [Sphingobium arseniciresistens]
MNTFISKLAEGRALIGLWQALATPYTAEICARAGFDWLLFDGEHAPNTVQTLLAQLQAVSALSVEPIARVPLGEPVAIKQYLDIGFRTLLVPMVDNADQARDIVAATRFPPRGVRGVASATSRASNFGGDKAYLAEAHERVAVIAQIESAAALEAVEEIAAIDGIDALFIGPADLAASLGYLGEPGHPQVQSKIKAALASIKALGKPVGIFATSPADAREKITDGFAFISAGTDIGLITSGANGLLASLRN